MFLVALGTAHTGLTAGKCSPDGSFREAVYSREICEGVKETLIKMGYNCVIDYIPLEPKEAWKSPRQKTMQSRELAGRTAIVNKLCQEWGKSHVLYVSIHVNAAGSGAKWLTAGGWAAYTTRGKTAADYAATKLYRAAENHLKGYADYMASGKRQGRYDSKQKPYRTDYTDGDPDNEADFHVLANTACPAVLTENLFQDNKSDVEFLTSEAGKRAIINLHVEGIIDYIESL